MRKYAVLCACGLAAAMMFTGCGQKEETAETTQAQTESAAETDDTEGADQGPEITGEVELGEYKGITVTKQNTDVSDEELQVTIDSRLEAAAELVEVDRPAEEGDTVNIDYVGMKDGEAFDGGTAEGYDLRLGSGRFIDGFEDGLIGAVKGQELSLNLTFPEEYPNNPDLAGQPVVFDVTVNKVQESQAPALDAAFVEEDSDGQFTDVEAWKENLREQLIEQKEQNAQTIKESEVLQALIDGCTFTGIEESVDAVYDQQVSQMENMAAIYGMTFADMAGMYGMDEQAYKDMLYTQAENSVKVEIALEKIAETEGLEVTDEDRQKVADEYQAESVDQLLEQLGEGGEEAPDNYALHDKTLDFVVENAVEQ